MEHKPVPLIYKRLLSAYILALLISQVFGAVPVLGTNSNVSISSKNPEVGVNLTCTDNTQYVNPGNTVQYTINVTNTGTEEDTILLSTDSGRGAILFSEDWGSGTYSQWTKNVRGAITDSILSGEETVTDATKSGETYWIYTYDDTTRNQHDANVDVSSIGTGDFTLTFTTKISDTSASQMGQICVALLDINDYIICGAGHKDPNGGILEPCRMAFIYGADVTTETASATETVNWEIVRTSRTVTIKKGGVTFKTGTCTSSVAKLSILVGAYGGYPFLNYLKVDNIVLSMGPSSDTSSEAGLVASWHFDENTGDTVYDSSGNNNDGTIHGATWTTGVSGSALKIEGDFVSIPDIVEGLQHVTISIWVNEQSMSVWDGEAYIWFGDHSNAHVDISHFGDNLYYTVMSTSIEIPFSDTWRNTFQNYVLVYNGETGILKAYRNGALIEEKSGPPSNVTTYKTYAGIAKHWWYNGGSSSTRFNGLIDEVCVYNRALNASEIQQHYAGTVGETTILFFDDFNGTSLDTSKWETNITGTGSATVSNGVLTLYHPATIDYTLVRTKTAFPTDTIVEIRAKSSSLPSYNHGFRWGYAEDWIPNYKQPNNTNEHAIFYVDDYEVKRWSWGDGTNRNQIEKSSIDTANYKEYKIHRNTTSRLDFYYDNTLSHTATSYIPLNDLYIQLGTSDGGGPAVSGYIYVDYVKVVGKTPAIIPSGWNISLSTNSTTLNPGESADVILTVTVPSGTLAGNYTINVTGVSQSNSSVSDTVTLTVIVNQIADVDVTTDSSSIIGDPGETLTCTFTVTNAGNGMDSFDLNATSEQGWNTNISGGINTGNLNPSKSRSVTVEITIPLGTAPSTMDNLTFTATSKFNSSISNSTTIRIAVTPVFDVILTCADNIQYVDPGGTVQYTINVKNNGTTEDTILLSHEFYWFYWDVSFNRTSVILNPGESTNVVATITVPNGASARSYTTNVIGTSQMNSSVSDTVTLTVIVKQIANVTVIPASSSITGDPNTTVICSFQVKNTGNGADTFTFKVRSQQGWTTEIYESSKTINSKESASVSAYIKIPSGTLAGTTDTITLTARSQLNNIVFSTGAVTITVNEKRIVNVTVLLSNKNPTENDVVTITAKIVNNGNVDLTNVTVKFFDGENEIGTKTIYMLSIGASEDVSIEWRAKGWGKHSIKVEVYTDGVKETVGSSSEIGSVVANYALFVYWALIIVGVVAMVIKNGISRLIGSILLLIGACYSLWYGAYNVIVNYILMIFILIAVIMLIIYSILIPKEYYERQKRKMVGVFGTSGAGKTTYIATLAEMIWQGRARPYWSLEVPTGLEHVRDVIKLLKKGEWPARTMPGTREFVELKISDSSGMFDKIHHVLMDDISGEEFERFIRHPDAGSLPDTLININRCQGFIILIDPTKAEDESYDYHSLVQYLVMIKGLRDRGRFRELFAFLLTKNDEHNIRNPEEFVRTNMAPLYQACRKRMKTGRVRFFTCSSVGGIVPETRKPRIPLEPLGIEEPVEWMTKNIKVVKVKKRGIVARVTGKIRMQDTYDTYRRAVEQAMANGRITEDEEAMLDSMRRSLGITPEEHRRIMGGARAKPMEVEAVRRPGKREKPKKKMGKEWGAEGFIVCSQCGMELPRSTTKCPRCGSTKFEGTRGEKWQYG